MEQEENFQPRHRHTREQANRKLLKLRNVLNLIFMLGAVVGVCIYLFSNETTGIYIILGAMSFKIVECTLRFLN